MGYYINKHTGEKISTTEYNERILKPSLKTSPAASASAPQDQGSLIRSRVNELPAGQQDPAFAAIAVFKNAKEVTDILDKGLKTGPISGASKKLGQIVSGKDTDFNRFNSGTTQLTSNFIKAISGVQVSDRERKFLMASLPSPYKQEQVNRDNIATLLTFLKNKYETQLGVDFTKMPEAVPLPGITKQTQSTPQPEQPRSTASFFAEEFPKQAAKTLLQTPARFLASAAIAPVDIARQLGGGQPFQGHIPGIGQTYQAQAANTQQDIIEGKEPLTKALQPFLEVPMAALETVGIAKLAKGAAVGTKRLFEGRKTARAIQDAIELTSPALAKKDKIAAFAQAGKPGGVVKSRFGSVTRTPSKEDIEVAKAASPFLKGKDPIKSVDTLGKEISRFSDESVRPYLKANPRAYNQATLSKALQDVDPPDWIKADATAERTYSLVKQRMVEATTRHPGTMEGLWDSRISFDQTVKQQFGDAILDPTKRSFVNRAVRDMRHAVHDFIASQTGDSQFKESMKYLSRLYTAIDNIAEKYYATVNAPSPIKRLATKGASAIGYTALGIGTGVGLSSLTGQRQ